MDVPTAKVRSNKPGHEQGYFIKNVADLTESDILFDAPASAKADKVITDPFSEMDKDELKAHLTEQEIAFHHMSGETKLRELAREHADLV